MKTIITPTLIALKYKILITSFSAGIILPYSVKYQNITGINIKTISHEDVVTISGSGFGLKAHGNRLIWDDFESGANRNWSK